MTQAYPLQWPDHKLRTQPHRQERSRFRVSSFAVVRDELMRELGLLGAKSVVLSSNIPLRNDGLPYANFKRLDDTAAAVYFQYKGKPMCFACDRWERVEDNIQAIRHTINALRGIARWGSGDMLEAAFTGFQALPPPSSAVRTNETWWGVLKCSRLWDIATIEKHYREMARLHHPDNGGSDDEMAKLNTAIAQARKEKSGQES